jgi:hypothetical protein
MAHGATIWPSRRMLYDPAMEMVRAALGPAAFAAAWREGRAMTREQAIADALEPDASGQDADSLDSPQDDGQRQQVLGCVAR